MTLVKSTIAAMAVTALSLGTISGGALILTTDYAYAKGNGGGNGGDRGNSGGNGGGKDKDRSKPSKDRTSSAGNSNNTNGKGLFGFLKKKNQDSTTTQVAAVPSKPAKAVNRGALASELKGLNAAHANPNALANASPDSMVGKVAAYQTAVNNEGERDLLEDSLVALEEELATLVEGYDGRSAADIQSELDAINASIAELDPTVEEDAATLSELQASMTALQSELDAANTYDSEVSRLTDEIASVETEIEELGPTPEEALAIASDGRDLSPEAMAELHKLLGLPAPGDDPAVEGEPTTEDVAEAQ